MPSSALNSGSRSIHFSYRIIGLGNAGVNFLDRLLLKDPAFSGLIALNNDAEALAASVVTTKLLLPSELDGSSSFSSQDLAKALPQLVKEMDQASVVILVGGLGGGCASILLPHVARMSKAIHKTTLACVSLPFSFEGKRTQFMAAQSMAALEKECDGLIFLDNDRLCAKRASISALEETFTASDEAMEAILPALLTILFNKGPVRITRADFLKALQYRGSKHSFGYGEAIGGNRLHEALERALKNPLLDRGRCLPKANHIFLLLRGPKDISFAEVQAAMQEVERLAGSDHDIQLSVYPEKPSGESLQIFLLAIIGGTPAALEVMKPLPVAESRVPKEEIIKPQLELSRHETLPSIDLLERPQASQNEHTVLESMVSNCETLASSLKNSTKGVKPYSQEEEGSIAPKKEREDKRELFPEDFFKKSVEISDAIATKSLLPSKLKQTQGSLNLKALQRGRFDKSEPTIFEGEDLDTPTYLRLGLKWN